MRPSLCLAFASLALGFAPAPFPKPMRFESDPNKADLTRLQGTWHLRDFHQGEITQEWGGKLEVTGSLAVYSWTNGQTQSVRTTRLLLNARDRPRSLSEWAIVKGTPESTSTVALYSIEGDTLTLCSMYEATTKPDSLKPGPERNVLIYRRAKP